MESQSQTIQNCGELQKVSGVPKKSRKSLRKDLNGSRIVAWGAGSILEGTCCLV